MYVHTYVHSVSYELLAGMYSIMNTLSARNIRHNILGILYFCATSHMTWSLSMGDLTRSVAALAKIDLDRIKSSNNIVKQVFMLLTCYTYKRLSSPVFRSAGFQKQLHAYKLNLV